MAEYIDRDATLEQLRTHYNTTLDGRKLYHPSMALAMHDVRNAPAADVVEVVHGRWIDTNDGETVCSNCGVRIPEMYSNADTIFRSECGFCHRCGADMRGDKHG